VALGEIGIGAITEKAVRRISGVDSSSCPHVVQEETEWSGWEGRSVIEGGAFKKGLNILQIKV